jgi:hypothetical protein
MSRRTELIPEPQPATQGAPPQVKRLSATTLGLVVGGSLIALVATIVLWPRETPAAPVTTVLPSPPLVATVIPATPTPSCASADPYLRSITAHEQAGRWKEATDAAEGALAISELCDADRRSLTHYAVSDGLKDLSTQVFEPLDREGQQRMVDRYLALKQRAQDANVPIDTPLQVAATAYGSSQFQLARVAIEEALTDGSFHPEIDRDITKMYISTMFGLGKWYTTAELGTPLYTEGLRWLSASGHLAEQYKTGQGDAAMLLTQLGYRDISKWPAHAATPLWKAQ